MRCSICGGKVDERLKFPHPDSLSFDHSHPLSLLGPHSQENQRVAHLHCNQLKGIGRLPVQMVLL
jgi:5-methylcytosine-specific restriction endonuclease McrA